jgi:hypothetical protein
VPFVAHPAGLNVNEPLICVPIGAVSKSIVAEEGVPMQPPPLPPSPEPLLLPLPLLLEVPPLLLPLPLPLEVPPLLLPLPLPLDVPLLLPLPLLLDAPPPSSPVPLDEFPHAAPQDNAVPETTATAREISFLDMNVHLSAR